MNQNQQNNDQKNQPQTSREKKSKPNSYALYSGLVIQMAAIIAVGTYIGIKLDENYPNENSLYTLGFTLASVIASIVYVIRRIIAD